jgi:hypothetical protein
MARNESKGKGLIQSLINSMCKKKLKNSTLYIKQFISTNMKYDGEIFFLCRLNLKL